MLPYQLTYSTKYILKHLFSDRIQVNDQIIEVDGVSLVGVTQIFAAQTLKNTSGLVRFLMGRDKSRAHASHRIDPNVEQQIEALRQKLAEVGITMYTCNVPMFVM
ncbi:hypothetical protein pdam_00013699 [Pocillopora damicornis]|uniref:PDZ domain-containing protein n=1 Tax=Pocillopora damicornis TaxID=46731 RepID=A0A3M6UKY6_POCDA|nr:hypothetical protein pdam_00013699 [Pocillopora damicornis]